MALDKEIRKNGYTYTLVKKNEHAFMYKQHMINPEYDNYEVFERRLRKPMKSFGKDYEEAERFPHNEAFGVWAWSICGYNRALDRFHQLSNKVKSKTL